VEGTPDLPKPGEVLSGKYELVRALGMGGMGVVFEAKHLRLQQRVAIKLLKPELLSIADSVTRFEREGRAAARMTSTNAARIFDVDVTPSGIPYMVIEFLEGHDLSRELKERGSLPAAEAVDIVLQACSAMAEAHSLGIVHRDLKPANLFLCAKGSGRTVKILDFGVSKILADEMPQTTTPSLTLGTPQYMSPEQILASKDVDLQSDIWSLGVILYKLLSGHLPFEPDSATAFVVAVVTTDPLPLDRCAAVPPGLAAAVMKALEKSRDARWRSVDELARAIQPFGSGRIGFTPASIPPPSGAQLPAAVDVDVPVDVDVKTLTDSGPFSSSKELPTQGNWTQNPLIPSRRRRWIGLAIGAAAIGLVGVGVAISASTSRPAAGNAGSASVDTTRLPAVEPQPTEPASAANAPLPSARAEASAKPAASVASSAARSKPPPPPPPVAKSASPARPPPPAAPNPTTDPVHL
jgi:serine/threonine-protein kinase